MIFVSPVVAVSLDEGVPAGMMPLRSSERPAPLKAKFVLPSKEVPVPLFVEKNMSA
jgi:hypothetical protein